MKTKERSILERSFWAWGIDESFPDDETRRIFALQAQALLGGGEFHLKPLPRFEDLRLPEPRIAVPPAFEGFCTANARDRVMHTYGKSYCDIVRAFRGDFSPAPDFVAYPQNEHDILSILRYCSDTRCAVIPFGGGTNVVGGVEGAVGNKYRGVISLDMAAFNKVLEIDKVSKAARIQAGALGPAIERQLGEHGLTMRHYPQSFEFSTLGGWIATRSGGHFATLYTHIDDMVESIRMVTPRGIMDTGRVPASGAGPSAERLLLGSEGILGIITEAWVRVRTRPHYRATASVFFESFEMGAAAVRDLSQAGLYPSNCRLLGAKEALLNGVPVEGGAVLLLGFENAVHAMHAWMDGALAICRAHGGHSPSGAKFREGGERGGDGTGEAWRKAFFRGPYLQSAFVTLGVIADTFETACTWDRFHALKREVYASVEEALKEVCGAGILMCRFTHVYSDGPAPYFTFLAPAREGEELEQWKAIKKAASDALLRVGATITHHHAVGRVHRPWYDKERPELFADALRGAKKSLDPAWILNPGVLLPLTEE